MKKLVKEESIHPILRCLGFTHRDVPVIVYGQNPARIIDMDTNEEIQNANNSVFDRYSEHNTLKKDDYYNYHLNTDQYLIKGSF